MENGTQSILQETKKIAQKVREYFAEVEKKEPLVAMDENNRICVIATPQIWVAYIPLCVVRVVYMGEL